MIVSIHQPCFLPWLGHFHRVACSDLHIVLDHVQIEHNTSNQFGNRNRIRTPQGWMWLTVPIQTKGQTEGLMMNRVQTAPGNWARKHWPSIQGNYARANFFGTHRSFFEEIYRRDWPYLAELCRQTSEYLYEGLGQKPRLLYSSEMNVPGKKDELVLNLCREVGATRYLSGPYGRDYLDLDAFASAGIEVEFHSYEHPVYEQAFPGFEPFMSALDLLLNHGPSSFQILSANQTTPLASHAAASL